MKNVDSKGYTRIKFDRDVDMLRNRSILLSEFNEEMIEMKAKSVYNNKELTFDWTALSFDQSQIEFRLFFDKPLLVSERSDEIQKKDILTVKIIKPELFVNRRKFNEVYQM